MKDAIQVDRVISMPYFLLSNALIHASPRYPPIFQEVTGISALHPCRHVQRDTGRFVRKIKTAVVETTPTITMSLSMGSVEASRTPSQMAWEDSRAGIIPSSWVNILNPRRACSSVATTYSALPESFNQACSGPTPG